jgi:tetratricopeptide (TPR) repeat protein
MVWFLSACDSFWTSGQFASGRRAFVVKNYQEALAYFRKVADKKPGYVFQSMHFRESVWTYLGRCLYYLGNLAEARQSLERAITEHGDDQLARVFLGLTLRRQDDDANGNRQMERGLQGLNDWIEYENGRDPAKSFWDPSRQIRQEIARSLAMISDNRADRQTLIESVEWIGLKIEDEVDHVRRDRRRGD